WSSDVCSSDLEEHVWRPTAAADQNATAIDAEKPSAFWRRFGSDLADAETQVLSIGDAPIVHEFERKRVKLRLAELERPPQAWIREAQLRKTVGREPHQRAVVRGERHRLAERDAANPPAQRTGDGA